ncbi:Glutathione-regulated potassium-efflux system ancillary protein kefF [Raoultella terrigena]|jgi:NAD(P)H dehydrogenase (quinone)|uniref:NAD(P)H-dependent oxidoreductase n=1 Tax=Raoultella terrigena TaxID=577 RepID=UPI0010EB8E59|nr:NAD(P)H-dependent oxidoreductase [Raoultella terrigena]MEB8195619.1 NAD(P)H-dependent oxidoreductase [Raoultella terrigena]VTM23818.1 Glutathione-regulated potassium-efflux system ancillary protein kefF [Raoultella terrigena]
MKVLLIYAHPQPRSLNGTLKDFAVQHLHNAGHEVQVSDLYAMRWKAGFDADDSSAPPVGEFWRSTLDSKQAFEQGTQSADIVAEQEKLLWADTVIFQFPLWWFSMPAIMKGWIDRVYANGFAYGVGEQSDRHWGDRYGEGTLAGKRAMLVVTTGGWEEHYAPRGINGPINDILFPIQHGMLFYPGFEVLPPLVFYRTEKTDEQRFMQQCRELGQRLDTLASTAPIPFRRQNYGDYLIPSLTLRPELAVGESGLTIHQRVD